MSALKMIIMSSDLLSFPSHLLCWFRFSPLPVFREEYIICVHRPDPVQQEEVEKEARLVNTVHLLLVLAFLSGILSNR
jgi:hypothetical protein